MDLLAMDFTTIGIFVLIGFVIITLVGQLMGKALE